jgi:hypothetical protein
MEKDSSDKVYQYLTNVKDKETFIAFVEVLAEEREKADELEKENPIRYQLGGALNWQNGDISSFLWSALSYFEDSPRPNATSDEPTWKGFAQFLYFGKIYE